MVFVELWMVGRWLNMEKGILLSEEDGIGLQKTGGKSLGVRGGQNRAGF